MDAMEAQRYEPVRAFAGSGLFLRTFDEAMALVQQTAAYLDGAGRVDSVELDHHGQMAYAAESMQLTTRLMQVSSWLLAQRAVHRGQLQPREAAGAKYRLAGGENDPSRADQAARLDLLPPPLAEIIAHSLELFERARRLDAMLYDGIELDEPPSPVTAHLERIRAAFDAE